MNSGELERAVTFSCEGESLVGVLHESRQATADLAVLMVVGGPQYRAGSHRYFVLLARALAAAGYPVLRFDHRGIGDSDGRPRSFEAISHDIACATDALQGWLPSVTRVVLWGLCDGASAALLYCDYTHDVRVAGLCVVNPWIRSAASLVRAEVRHYYFQRLRQPAFWRKLLSGKVSTDAVPDFLRKSFLALRAPGAGANEPTEYSAEPYQQRMARAWRDCGAILLIVSGNDFTAKEFLDHAGTDAAWSGLLQRPGLQTLELPSADHTLSERAIHADVAARTIHWVEARRSHAGTKALDERRQEGIAR